MVSVAQEMHGLKATFGGIKKKPQTILSWTTLHKAG